MAGRRWRSGAARGTPAGSAWNRRGIWSNRQDDLAGLHAAFSAHFERYEIDLVGGSALFTAWA